MNQQYIVKWASKLTGATGQSSPVDEETARDWVEQGSKEYPDYTHWYEAAPAVEGWRWDVVGFPGKKAKEGKR